MPLLHILILALVQGVTEFLPISSSGHLLLLHDVFDHGSGADADRQNLLIDVAVHVGTLFSVLVYFREDVVRMVQGGFRLLRFDFKDKGAQLDLHILLSSVPVILVGFALHHFEVFEARNIEIVAWTTLIFGVLLWAADTFAPQRRTLSDLNWRRALMIGLAQALALIPGTSRSGVTMTAARGLGFTRIEAARYSLLLSIIAISGAGALGGLSVVKMDDLSFTMNIAIAAGLAFVSGLVAITLMMKWLAKASFTVFAVYRVLLGGALLAIVYGLV